ncbi:MAG: heme ABC exporter ATP-binding protein CcmA [Gemmatimonadaceae bacterium]|nr:heme ABC exporter ATP-binding protein CcmA [Gemmatimonadaceae bacterium]
MRRTIRLARVNVRTSESGVAAATIQAVTRRFGRRWALRGVSLSVAPGEVVGIEGHNGSGKSTLLRILSTAIKPTSGEARVYGVHVGRDATTVRGLVALLTHYPGLYDDLTAEENLKFTCRMLGMGFARIPVMLERVGLGREAMEPVRSFSAGMQRRLSLARLLLQQPRLLLLDEPYNNFDSSGIALINDVVRDVRDAGGAAMIVLHDRHSAGNLLDRVVRLGQGLVIEDRPLDPAGAADARGDVTEASGVTTGVSGSETRDVNEPSDVGFTRWTSA